MADAGRVPGTRPGVLCPHQNGAFGSPAVLLVRRPSFGEVCQGRFGIFQLSQWKGEPLNRKMAVVVVRVAGRINCSEHAGTVSPAIAEGGRAAGWALHNIMSPVAVDVLR